MYSIVLSPGERLDPGSPICVSVSENTVLCFNFHILKVGDHLNLNFSNFEKGKKRKNKNVNFNGLNSNFCVLKKEI